MSRSEQSRFKLAHHRDRSRHEWSWQPFTRPALAALDAGNDELVGGNDLAPAQGHRDQPAAVALDAGHGLGDPRIDALAAQSSLDLLGERFLTAEQPLTPLDQGDPRAQGLPGLRELAAHDATAEHDQPMRHLLARGRLAVGPRPSLAAPVDGRHGRGAAGRDRTPSRQPLLADAHGRSQSSLAVAASRAPRVRRVSASTSAGRGSALDDMHAENKHSPPTRCSSTMATSRPGWACRPSGHLAGRPRAHDDVELGHGPSCQWALVMVSRMRSQRT